MRYNRGGEMLAQAVVRPILLVAWLVFLAALLSGCSKSAGPALPSTRTEIPQVPARYRLCFDRVALQAPGPEGWSYIQVVTNMALLAESEAKMATCGKDAVDWANGSLDAIRGTTP
jgi:hypothetical protein